MCFMGVRINMRWLMVSSILLIFLSSVSGAGGVNEQMSLEGTSIVSMDYDDYVHASKTFEIEIVLDSQASENGTKVIWVTQICINSGVCYPPENNEEWISEDGGKLIGSIDVDDDASYVNWRVKMNWSDGGEENFPESGFGWKVWSNCWFDGEKWGGMDDECNSEKDEHGGSLYLHLASFVSVILVLVMVLLRKNNSQRK